MIIALETAGQTTRAWLFEPKSSTVGSPQLEWESGRQLSEQLLGRLQELLQQHKQQFADLTGIVILAGPGSFTSLRIGHTVANALADSLGIPIASAQGHDWIATAQAQLASTPIHKPALPFYGAEAHITRPKS